MSSGSYRPHLTSLSKECKTLDDQDSSSSALLYTEESPEETTHNVLDATSSAQNPYRHNSKWLHGWRRSSWGWSILRLMTICLAVLGGFDLARRTFAWLSKEVNIRKLGDETSCSCGSSLAEARALSCRYDTIAAAWLPPHCRDDELMAQFDAAGPGQDGVWNYYADEIGLQTISPEAIALLPENDSVHHFFTTHRWHILHCSYYWRKLHRMTHGVKGAAQRMEARSDNDAHIDHCEMMFLKRDALEDIVTGSGVSLDADVITHHQD